ncbi:MAG: glycosyltransferase family 4 protein [Deltaproteobacteria bacterium]|nr:glycosyltransferase family 4 protein [Deltaproteobacteria bacterium]
MKRVLYLYRDPPFARFIKDDLRILRERYWVDDVHVEPTPRTLAKLAVSVARADLVYFWWGDLTGLLGAALAALSGKPSVMITGGYDVADVPEIRYGLRYHPYKRFLPPIVLRLATKIIANAEVARDGVIKDFRVDTSRIVAIPHGLDAELVTPGQVKKERRVLTCSLLSRPYIPYKGLDTFVRAARRLPDVPFIQAGPDRGDGARRELEAIAPPNVRFTGFLSDAELLDEMRRATVYAQLSAHEGFGIALAEAMLAGATPVVTNRGAIPEVVGAAGKYVEYGDVEGTARAIETALQHPDGEAARQRIAETFPLSRRRAAIHRIVDELTS